MCAVNLSGVYHSCIMDFLLKQISHDPYLSKVDFFAPSGWIGHAPFLKFLIREQAPRVFVELGVHNGFSYFVGCQSIIECQLETKAYAVDHWIGDPQAGYFDSSIFMQFQSYNLRFGDFSSVLKMDFSDALLNFENGEIDLLHIDGFHSYESVSEDFDSWLPKMSQNGVILLHDIFVHREGFGVYVFWKELKEKYKTIEFVGSHGLGVVFLGTIPSNSLGTLYSLAQNGFLSDIQGAFGSISDDVIQGSKLDIIESLIKERDKALKDFEIISNSKIWLAFKPYRWFKSKL